MTQRAPPTARDEPTTSWWLGYSDDTESSTHGPPIDLAWYHFRLLPRSTEKHLVPLPMLPRGCSRAPPAAASRRGGYAPASNSIPPRLHVRLQLSTTFTGPREAPRWLAPGEPAAPFLFRPGDELSWLSSPRRCTLHLLSLSWLPLIWCYCQGGAISWVYKYQLVRISSRELRIPGEHVTCLVEDLRGW
jgi:hypothetical protein